MISIIIPTFKSTDYLFDCLKSIEFQILPKEFFKVIIVLNGDKEPYYQRINTWLNHMSFNHELLFTDQKGVSNARNLGLELCQECDYVSFIDDDDFISPNYLSSLLDTAKKSPVDSIICSDVRTIAQNGDEGFDYISYAYQNSIQHPQKDSLFTRRKFLSSSCCKLIPRKLISNNRFSTKLRLGEDSFFMASISNKISKIIPAPDDAVYYRRLRNGSASRKKEKFTSKWSRKIMLINLYIRLYFSKFPQYNLPFLLSRIVAIIVY